MAGADTDDHGGDDRSADDGSLLNHLIELRSRLLRAIVGLLIVFLGLLPFANRLYTLLAQPLVDKLPKGAQLIAVEVASPFFAPDRKSVV